MLKILADALLIALRASPINTPRDHFPSRPQRGNDRWTKRDTDQF